MKNFKLFISIGVLLGLQACKPSPVAIDYGNESCKFCQMTIVDKIHGAELVTQKAKVYKFDAIECMLHFLDEMDSSKVELLLINEYSTPELLVDAEVSTYLISENIPSPMGAFLTGFKNREAAMAVQKKKGGDIYNWKELKSHFKN